MWLLQVGVPWRVLCGYSDATVTGATLHAVAREYPCSTLQGTQTCSSHSGIVSQETYVADQEESRGV